MDDLELGGNYFEFSKIGAIFEKILSYAQDRENADAYALLGAYYRYLANQIAPYGRHGSNFGSRWDNNKQKYINSDETKKNKEKYEEYIKQAEHFESYIKKSPINLHEINLQTRKQFTTRFCTCVMEVIRVLLNTCCMKKFSKIMEKHGYTST